ncbi:hypothetical protein Tco_0220222, partial [Tanacetum coccineum]
MDEVIEQVYDANKDIVEEGEVQVSTTDMEVNIVEPITTLSAPVTTAGVSVSTASVNISTTEPITTHEPKPSETATRPTVPPQQLDPKDKGKGKMVEPEKPLKRKDQIKFDEEIAQKLQALMQAKLEEEERLARQREEDANIAEWDDIQAMMDAYYVTPPKSGRSGM